MAAVAATLFGDDGDARPLWFRKEAFMDAEFDPDAYIANLRSFVPLEALRSKLRSHLSVLKAELVDLINRDYNDFVNLSTKLVDVDGAVLRMRAPLQELRSKLVSVRDSVEYSLFALQDALKRRSEASSSREILELLLDTSHVLSKIEKLLHELQTMQEDGHQSVPSFDGETGQDLAEAGDDPCSRLLERIASEMNRLKFYVASVQDLPFIKNMEKRIQKADASLGESLEKCFEQGLQKRDEKVIHHCLRAYAAIDYATGAEEVFRRTIVAPFVSKIILATSTRELVGAVADKLEEHFIEIEQHIQADCKFFLDITASEDSGLHVFDFLGNSILKEVHTAIQRGKPGALSPGKPADFLENYKSCLKFLSFVEGFCPSQSAVLALRSRPGYIDFMKLWNLGVYFTLRFQEIATSFDNVLNDGLKRTPSEEDGLLFHSSVKLWELSQRCWSENVYVAALADKFLKLSLQLTSRYVQWILHCVASRRTNDTSAEDFLLVRHDLERLHGKFNGEYVENVVNVLGQAAEKLCRKSIFQASQSLLDVVPQVTEVISDIITEKCLEDLKALKGITTTFRMINKPLPTRHSFYVPNIFQSLKSFLDSGHNHHMMEACRNEILNSVVRNVTRSFDQQIRELVEGVRRTESSLLRIRQHRQRTGAGTDPNTDISNADKVYAQLFLDVQEYGRNVEAMGVNASRLVEFRSLWEFVAPQQRITL